MLQSAPHIIHLYCVRHSAKGRKHQRVTGSIAKNKLSRQSANLEREPWLLASNLPGDQWNPSKIVAIYKQRMQIEEGSSDVKSEYFGVGVIRHRSHCPRRIEVLLLILALAYYIICLTGLQAREAGYERHFQSNSLKRRRVLSLWRLGLEYWRSGRGSKSRKTLERLEHALRAEIHQGPGHRSRFVGIPQDPSPFWSEHQKDHSLPDRMAASHHDPASGGGNHTLGGHRQEDLDDSCGTHEETPYAYRPVTEQALALLEAIKPYSEHREYVFPAVRNPRTHSNSQTANRH